MNKSETETGNSIPFFIFYLFVSVCLSLSLEFSVLFWFDISLSEHNLQLLFLRSERGDVHGGEELLEVEGLFAVFVAEDSEDGGDEGKSVAAGKEVLK